MKHLLKLSDLSKKEILSILNMADQMKFSLMHGLEKKPLAGKTLAMIFARPSTRTRVSFETGMYQLGGQALYLSAGDLQLSRGEPIEDTARALSRYVDGVVIRTSAQKDIEDFAGFSTVPVINGLTDYAHPCETLADLMTIREKFSTLEGLNICFIGAGNNVCNSLIIGAITCGINISAATPKGYEPHKDVLKWAGERLKLTQSPLEAVKDADVVFTDTWYGMGQEAEAEKRIVDFQGFQVNEDLLKAASAEAVVLHCLPARRGEEISPEVFEAHSKSIFDAAENRLHVQKAVLAMLMEDDEDADPIHSLFA